ncbi:MAG: ABC transporter permease [Bacteroidales bacterium]|nr:ABC transporter permease [Bacteroidales bacterium]
MNKIFIIIRREYLSRVKKRSFIIMTILGPILMAALFVVPVYLANISDRELKVAVLDETGLFYNEFKGNEKIHYENLYMDYVSALDQFEELGYDALLHIPESSLNNPNAIKLLSTSNVGLNLVNDMESVIQKKLEAHRLALSGIDKKVLEDIEVNVKINTFIWQEGEEKQNYSEISYALGLISGLLIYIFIFLYGAQVMRGVIEEKTSRIVEVIVSSVKPFQLMMGKIVGIAFVGLTQFILWVLLTGVIVLTFQEINPDLFKYKSPDTHIIDNKGLTPSEIANQQDSIDFSQDKANNLLEGIRQIQFGTILLMFLFYFIGGYLLYASLFAAIGSAVDNETDTQQFMLPVTIPLILAIVSLQFVLNNPDGPVAFWMSMIPFTSPIVMMARIPFNPPVALWEIGLSFGMLIIGFVFTTWLASKIYRTGILMYGKKASFRELFKWLRF